MSKKNTFKTESDNNLEGDSPRTSSCNSAKSKSSFSLHLSSTEDARTGSSNNNTFVHQDLTSNSNSHSNIAFETLTNDKSYNTSFSSCSSLEEDLYGTSETFNKNLNSIKAKLQELELISRDRHSSNQSSSRSGSSQNDNAYSVNSEKNSSELDKPKGYLSSRDTLNIDEFPINEKYNSSGLGTKSYCNNLTSTSYDEFPDQLEAIEEVDEIDSDSLHYQVPNKKLCVRNFTPRIQNFKEIQQISDSNLNTKDSTDTDVTTKTSHKSVSSSSSTKSSKPSTSKTLVGNILAFGSDSSSSKKCKYANFVIQDDGNFNATNSNQTNAKGETRTNNQSSSSSILSINSHSKSNSNFINKNFFKVIAKTENHNIKSEPPENVSNNETEEICDLRLNLPSSIGDDSSSYRKDPIEPNVVVLKKFEGKRRKKYSKNKVGPHLESEGSTTSSSCSSTSMSNVNESTLLYRRYYEATPEISSRTNSSLSCIISSVSNRSPSVKSKLETQHKNKLSQRSSESSAQQNYGTKNESNIDSALIASLEVPKVRQQGCDFPSITKITISPEKFTKQAWKGDADIESDNDGSEKNDNIFSQLHVNYSCYTDKAKLLINSPTISPVRRVEIETRKDHCYGDLRLANREIAKCTHFKENSIRKLQSTEHSFYKLPSECDSSEDLTNKCITVDTTQRTIPRDSSADRKCKKYCCFIFFSRGNQKFF